MKYLIFLVAMICEIIAFASNIDINRDFKQVKNDLPLNWQQNKGSWGQPFAKVALVKNDTGNLLIITA